MIENPLGSKSSAGFFRRFFRFLSAASAFLFFVIAFAPVASAESTAEVPLTISGRVVGPDGAGVAGAEVRVKRLRPTYERLRDRDREPSAEAPRRRTDGDGFFSWRIEEPGPFGLTVEAEGFRPQRFHLKALVQPVFLPVLQMRKNVPLTLTVLDPEGRSVVGAEVLTVSRWNQPVQLQRIDRTLGSWMPTLKPRLTDESGQATIPAGLGESHGSWVTAPGFVPGEVEWTGKSTARVTLSPGKSHRIRLVEADGKPLAAAQLLLRGSWLQLGETDNRGEADLVIAPKGELAVSWMAPDGRRGSVNLEDRPGDAVRSITVAAPVRIEGRVQSEDGEGIGRVWVVPTFDPGSAVSTDADGTFRLVLPTEEEVAVTPVAAGWTGSFFERISGKNRTPVLTLTPAAAVRGRVTDEGGDPVAFAEVVGSHPGSDSWDFTSRRSTRSNARGDFFLPVPFPRKLYRLTGEKTGYAGGKAELPPLDPWTVGRRDLVLRTGRQVVGQVIDASDVPVGSATVELQEEPRSGGDMGRYLSTLAKGGAPEHEVSTDREGRFTARGLDEQKTYRLRARAPGFAPTTVPGIALDGAGGTAVDLGQVVLLPGVRVVGVVVDKDDRPIAGARVEIVPGGAQLFRQRDLEKATDTAADGSFRLADLVPGEPITLEVTREGYVSLHAANVVPDADPEPIRAVMTAASRISGRVASDDGEPVARAVVYVRGQGSMSQEIHASTDEKGRFVAEGVAPGRLNLRIEAEGYQTYRRSDLEPAEGQNVEDLEILLARGVTLFGKLSDADGRPVQDASLMVKTSAADFGRISAGRGVTQTDSDGRFRLEGLGPGTHEVVARAEGFPPMTRSVPVAEEDVSVEWTLRRGVQVTGRVIDGVDGSAISGAEVVLRGASGLSRGISEADGRFTVKGLKTGEYVVEGSRAEYATGRLETPLQVGAEGFDGLEIRLDRGAAIRGRVLGLGDFDALSETQILAFSEAGQSMAGLDFEGRFRFEHLAPGDWSITAYHEGRMVVESVTLEPGQGEAEVTLEFEPGSELVGRVLYRGGALAGAQIRLQSVDGGIGYQGVSGLDGAFSLAEVPDGDYRIYLSHSANGLSHRDRVSLPHAGELVLELSSTRVGGTVRDASTGESLAQARLALEHVDDDKNQGFFPRSLASGQAISDTEGGFHLGELTEGSWTLRVTKEGYGADERTLHIGPGTADLNLDVRLKPTDQATLRVLDADGSPVEQVRVAVLGPDGRLVTAERLAPDSAGLVRLSTAPAGTWEILLSDDDGPVLESRLTVPGETVVRTLPRGGLVSIQLRSDHPDARSRVRVTDPTGRPYRGLDHRGAPWPEELPLVFTTAQKIRLPAGTWRIEVLLSGGGTTEARDVSVTEGSTQEVIFDVRGGS